MIELGCGQVQRHKDKNKVCCNHWLCDKCLFLYGAILGAGILIGLLCYYIAL